MIEGERVRVLRRRRRRQLHRTPVGRARTHNVRNPRLKLYAVSQVARASCTQLSAAACCLGSGSCDAIPIAGYRWHDDDDDRDSRSSRPQRTWRATTLSRRRRGKDEDDSDSDARTPTPTTPSRGPLAWPRPSSDRSIDSELLRQDVTPPYRHRGRILLRFRRR